MITKSTRSTNKKGKPRNTRRTGREKRGRSKTIKEGTKKARQLSFETSNQCNPIYASKPSYESEFLRDQTC
eukprot:2858653-Amphidinium_carterae.1